MENVFQPLTPPSDATPESSVLMKRLADNDSLEGLNVDGDALLLRTKLFLVAQACNELNRVIKMTNLLDNLESKFIEAINTRLDESPANLQLITYAMETITESLNRSNSIITQVLKDEKLSSIIINTTNIITPDGSSATIMDMNSRDAIRNMASCLLAELRNSSDDVTVQSEEIESGDESSNE